MGWGHFLACPLQTSFKKMTKGQHSFNNHNRLHSWNYGGNSKEKMLESRPEDALIKLVKTVEIVETVTEETVETEN